MQNLSGGHISVHCIVNFSAYSINFSAYLKFFIITCWKKKKGVEKEGLGFSSLKASERSVMDTWLCVFNSFNIESLSGIFRFL